MKTNLLFVYIIIQSIIFFSLQAQNISFTEHVVQDNFDGPTGLFITDINIDGKNDIIATSSNLNQICWWQNNGGKPIEWTKHIIDDDFTGAIYVYAKDVDGDSLTDVIAAAWWGNEISWWKNEGGNPVQWTKQIIDSTVLQAHEVFAYDVDKDNDIDIVGASAQDNAINWWRNDGSYPISWTKQTISNTFYGARSVCVDDINRDGYNDIIGAALVSNEISWWQNNGVLPITWSKVPVVNNFLASHKVTTYDFDGDQDKDILGTAYTNNQIAWWINNGDSPVTWTKSIVDGNFQGSVIAYPADLDFDGDTDVVGTAQGSSQIAWWRNDGGTAIAWVKESLNPSFGGVWPLYLGDLDGDSDIDIVAGGNSANEIRWWENSLYNVDFTATPSTGHAPLEVNFSDNSNLSEPVQSWAWDFNNDGIFDSFEQNPSWIYNSPGNYSVSLKTNGSTISDSLTKFEFVKVFNGESALLFNNYDSYALSPAKSSLNLTDSLTIEAWINPYGWGENSMFGYGRIIDKYQIAIYLIHSHPAYNDRSLLVQLKHSSGFTSRFFTADSSIMLNHWQHIAFSYDGSSSSAKIYIDGIEQVLTYAFLPSGSIVDNSSNDLIIGNDTNQNATFDGLIDEVRIWNTIRSGSEIYDLRNQCLLGNESELVGYWQMNEGYGDTLTGLSTHNNLVFLNNTNWSQGVSFSPSIIKDTKSEKLPGDHSLFQNYPNPFNCSTTIKYKLSEPAEVKISIYNLSGKLVKSIYKGNQNIGKHTTIWNGKDDNGNIVSTGLYICRLSVNQSNYSKKILLVK